MNLKQLVLGAHLGLSRNAATNYATFAGTVSVTNGSPDVTGAGTTFTGLAVNQTIAIAINPFFWIVATVLTITDDTHIVLAANWGGDTLAGLTAYKQAVNVTSAAIKPVTAVVANWLPLGRCFDLDYQRNAQEDDVVVPLPGGGAYEPADKIYIGSKPVLKVTLDAVSELVFESVFGSAPVTDSTPFTPFAGSGQIRGWWQIKQYDSANNLVLLIEQYGIGKFAGIKAENKMIKPAIEIAILANSQATGTSTLAAA